MSNPSGWEKDWIDNTLEEPEAVVEAEAETDFGSDGLTGGVFMFKIEILYFIKIFYGSRVHSSGKYASKIQAISFDTLRCISKG